MPLYVEEVGPTNASTIVLLHEAGFSGWIWKPQIDRLRNDYHLLIPDLPEHGRSSDIKPFTISGSASSIAELIHKRAHARRAHVVGIAVGGQITLELLSQAQEIVDSAMISGVTVKSLPYLWFVNLMMRLYWPFKNSQRVIQWSLNANGFSEEYLDQFAADTRSLTFDKYHRITRASSAFRIPSKLDQVQVDTLILLSAFERKLRLNSALELTSVMPNAVSYIIPDAKPFWNLEFPELFSQVIEAWITGQELPTKLVPLQ